MQGSRNSFLYPSKQLPSVTQLILCWLLAGAGAWAEDGDTPAIQYLPDEGAILVTGITKAEDAATEELLQIYIVNHDVELKRDTPPIAGTYSSTASTIRYTPLFGFEAGMRYCAKLNRIGVVPLIFSPEKKQLKPTTTVSAIYPGGDILPENQLRFYLHFSAPMNRGFASGKVKLFSSNREQVDLPFLELNQELWDPEHRRLTLFFDPGRVKRGLKPHEDNGPVLVAGETYTLVVEESFEDANGLPLASSFRKTFRAGPVDYTQPDPAQWVLSPPVPDTSEPLTITFEAPLDHGMLQRMITVLDSRGERVDGNITVGQNETTWSFSPEAPWKSGEFKVRVDRLLEDSCGNSIERHFEISRAERKLNLPQQPYTTIKFHVGSTETGKPPHQNWGEWRGPHRTGISSETNLPVSWNPGELLVWKTETAGPGASTPIVWGDRVFITAQTGRDAKIRRPGVVLSRADDELRLCIQCFSRTDGELLWEHRMKPTGTLTPTHSLHNQCTPSCVTDGERVIAWFATGQLHCFDMEGKPLWQRDLAEDYGAFDLLWAHASSPTLFGDLVYVLCDHNPQANLIALSIKNGEEVWRVNRGSGLRSYSTPLVNHSKDQNPQLIINSNPGIDGYDARTGKHLWHFEEFCKVPVPVPSVVNGTLYASRGYSNGPFMAMPLPEIDHPASAATAAVVQLSKTDTTWRLASRAPYVSSPLVYNGRIYLASEDGQVRCHNQDSGEILWSRKLGNTFWATPVAGDGKVYLLDETGEMIVLADGEKLTVLSRNHVPLADGERMLGSPSISHGCLFFRSESHLFSVGVRQNR